MRDDTIITWLLAATVLAAGAAAAACGGGTREPTPDGDSAVSGDAGSRSCAEATLAYTPATGRIWCAEPGTYGLECDGWRPVARVEYDGPLVTCDERLPSRDEHEDPECVCGDDGDRVSCHVVRCRRVDGGG